MRDEPVIICAHCGVGFLRNPGSKVHPTPVWFTSWSDSGGTCGGPLLMRSRATQMYYLNLTEDDNA